MTIVRNILLAVLALIALLIIGGNLWGMATFGHFTPAENPVRAAGANRVVLITGATGSVGDGLLKAVMAAPEVEKVYALTRRMSPRLEEGQASGRVQVILQEDFTDYSQLENELAEVNTVMWGLGTTSIGMDPELFRHIHEDFPVAFVDAWLAARQGRGPMAFHYVTGMGTGEEKRAQWAQDKGRAERRVSEMAAGTGLRTFAHRSGLLRPTDENPTWRNYLPEALLKPGHVMIRGSDLGRAMLEMSARTEELPNGAIVDNKDAANYAAAYRNQR